MSSGHHIELGFYDLRGRCTIKRTLLEEIGVCAGTSHCCRHLTLQRFVPRLWRLLLDPHSPRRLPCFAVMTHFLLLGPLPIRSLWRLEAIVVHRKVRLRT
eukprot:scaffold155787_cov29-Tisochrysis_lutea.AAC.6